MAMAKISELVKTYKLLNDPNAPDWNVRFVGGAVVALAVIAAAGALLWSAGNANDDATAPAAAVETEAPPTDDGTCQELPEGAVPSEAPAADDPCVPALP